MPQGIVPSPFDKLRAGSPGLFSLQQSRKMTPTNIKRVAQVSLLRPGCSSLHLPPGSEFAQKRDLGHPLKVSKLQFVFRQLQCLSSLLQTGFSCSSYLAEQGVYEYLRRPLAETVGGAVGGGGWGTTAGEGVADAAVGLNQLLLEVAIDLASQGADVDIDHVGQALKGGVPDMLKNHGSGNRTIDVPNQVLEQQKFFGAQIDGFPQTCGSPLNQIQLKISRAQDIDAVGGSKICGCLAKSYR